MSDPRRSIPAVDALLDSPDFGDLLARYPRRRVVEATRGVLETVRRETSHGRDLSVVEPYARAVADRLALDDVPSLRGVINATGVVLHTNLGRAPLARAAVEAMERVAAGYVNLEYDLETGARGSRYGHCAGLLRELTGADDAVVVNNAAAALLLALNTVAAGRGVVVSRGELIEIGGGFRIPEILARSGARLVEVGSTNRTRVADYAEAVEGEEVAAMLKVHRSNFRMAGFIAEAGLAELRALASRAGVALLYDLGSGLLADPAALGLPHEPRPAEALAEGADVVVFSGDKLLGGPQAGLAVGRAEVIGAMRANPLCRALRVDKVTLAALEETLRLYREPEHALEEVPVLRMLRASPAELEARARRLAEGLRARGHACEVAPGSGVVGGGTYPDVELPAWTVRLRPRGSASALAGALRAGSPPVVTRTEDDRVVVDPRTVLEGEEDTLLERLHEALGGESRP